MKNFLIFLFLFLFSVGIVNAKTTGDTIITHADGSYELVKGKYVGILSEGEEAQPNFVYELFDEPGQKDQWYLDNTVGDAEADIEYKSAVKELEGTKLSDIIVAVVDTGVDYTHLDLKSMMWDGKDCVSDTGSKIGGCIHGYSFAYGGAGNDPHPMKESYGAGYYHGTHVAGIIGAAINGNGVAGVAKNVKIMAIRADSGDGLNTFDLIRGIAFARENGAKVINASWGSGCGKPEDGEDKALKSEIANFPGIFVASAGNGDSSGRGCNHDVRFTVPSSYRSSLENMIVVAASDTYDKLTSFSDYGSKTVDVAAPGKDILSTVPGNKYAFLNGTSMAAPVVAGIAGAIWGINPETKTDVIAKIIRDTVDVPRSISGTVMYGRVDFLSAAKKAKSIITPPSVTSIPTSAPSCKSCKGIGDYNCDEVVNGLDYTWWKQEFIDKLQHGGKWEASFDCSGTVTSEGYSRWRSNYLK